MQSLANLAPFSLLGGARAFCALRLIERVQEDGQHQRKSAGVSFTSATAGQSCSAEAAYTGARSGAAASYTSLASSAALTAAPNPSVEWTA